MRFCDLITAVKSSSDRDHPRVDMGLHRRIGNRSFTSLVNNDNENPEITICDFAMKSQPLSQDCIWTIDLIHESSPRQLGTRGTTR
jgi:hypothetical protein